MQKEFKISYSEYQSINELDKADQELAKLAIDAMKNAYAPYSKFHVGAALKLENGEMILGNNQENIAYPSGLCAERVALFYSGANYPGIAIQTLCIVAKGDLIPNNAILSPCGSCRQVMLESENRQKNPIKVILINQDGSLYVVDSVKFFLPFGFGPGIID
jgi:cytidine deaminase